MKKFIYPLLSNYYFKIIILYSNVLLIKTHTTNYIGNYVDIANSESITTIHMST